MKAFGTSGTSVSPEHLFSLRSGSDPALRVVGFHPAGLPRIFTASDRVSLMDDSPRLSSPLSQLLSQRSGDENDTGNESSFYLRRRSETDSGCFSADSTDGDHPGSIGNETTVSEQLTQENESHLRVPFDHVAAAPIDIPYNAHGMRHWRR